MYTTKQVANQLGITDSHVRRLAIDLGIGQHFGHARIFSDDDVAVLQQRRTRPGPRTKNAPGHDVQGRSQVPSPCEPHDEESTV